MHYFESTASSLELPSPRNLQTGASAEKGYAGYGLSLCEKIEGLGLVQPGEEMDLRTSQQLPLLQGCSQEGRARLFTAVHGRRMRNSRLN